MGLTYNGYIITPAPLLNISKEYIYTGDGRPLSSTYNISLRGSLLPNRGSPNSSIATSGLNCFSTSGPNPDESWVTDDEKFESILRKQEAIRELFSNNGLSLEWQPTDGSPGVKLYPIIEGINFEPGTWVDRCNYEVRMSTSKIFSLAGVPLDDDFGEFDNFNIKTASDSFTLNELGDGSENFQLSRTVSATAFFQRNTAAGSVDPTPTDPLSGIVNPSAQEPWEYAKQWVLNKIGSNYDLESSFKSILANRTLLQPDISSSPTYNAYSRVRSEQIDRLAGSYSLTDNWILSKNSAIEDYTVTHETFAPYASTSIDNPVGGRNIYTIQGTVTGLQNDSTDGEYGSRWDNALQHFNTQILKSNAAGNEKFAKVIEKIANAVGVTYDTAFRDRLGIPETYTTSRNTRTGVIQFTFVFTDKRILNSDRFLNVQIQMSENNHEKELAVIPVPGRSNGPIIQNLGTQTLRRRTVSAVFSLIASNPTPGTNGNWTKNDLNGANGLRQEAIKILNGTTQNGIYNILPDGVEGTDWWLTSFSDGLDFTNQIYKIDAVFTIKGTGPASNFSSIGV